MKKKRNPLLILLLVLAVLLVVYAGVVVIGKNQEKSKQKEEEAKKIYVTDLGKLSEIQFDVGNGEIQLVKEDGTWYDKDDKDFPLAQSYPEQMEKTLGKLEAERKTGKWGFSGSIWIERTRVYGGTHRSGRQ